MINLVIYPDKPILIDKKHKLELLTCPTDPVLGLRYKDKHYYLEQGRNIHIEPNIRVNFFQVYKNKGISLGFDLPPNITVQRSLGKDKTGRHLWYTRKKLNRSVPKPP